MDLFDNCSHVNDLLNRGDEIEARNELIKILDYCEQQEIGYSPLINHLIRTSGLFPYIQPETALWDDRLVCEAFKVDVGLSKPMLLHREQSRVLKSLLEGTNVALSAPTSFGKSFIIDAFIAIKQPKNIMIIVPTIALTDETRRRLTQKFSSKYKIITTTGVQLAENNIFVFPQERAISYASTIDSLDILIIDEFYKADANFDKERSPSLLRAIVSLGRFARQKYFLAPNISSLKRHPLFTDGIEFIELKFNTVYLEMNKLFDEIGKDENKKSQYLLDIVRQEPRRKTLIYAGTYTNIRKVANLLVDSLPITHHSILDSFQKWLTKNYSQSWSLTSLVKRGVGVHSGELHRSLGQIQVKLFEEAEGLDIMISTSSIIEGVNTSAENVVLWKNKKGRARLDDFTYKNIIGRGGRMFKHFVGKIFILEQPPENESFQLNLALPDEILGSISDETVNSTLSTEDRERVQEFRKEMEGMIGPDVFRKLQQNNVLQTSDSSLHKQIVNALVEEPNTWGRLSWLNSDNCDQWDSMLYKLINLQPGAWETQYSKFVAFMKVLSRNWTSSIPELLLELDNFDLGIEEFFKLERVTAFRFGALLNDVNVLQKAILPSNRVDIGAFVTRVCHAFLPPVVYQLEEYGLPRMLSKRIHAADILNLVAPDATIHGVVSKLNEMGVDGLLERMPFVDDFERYIIDYFFNGIQGSSSSIQ